MTRLKGMRLPTAACALAGCGSALAADEATGVVVNGLALLPIGAAAVIVLTLLLRRKATPVVRRLAERLGRRRLGAILARTKLPHMHNVIIPGRYDGLSRIDCAVLTSAGIVSIRVQHGSGMVFGNATDPQWTRVRGSLCRQFLNPLIQNEGRVNSLQTVVPGMPVTSLVVFTGRVRFSLPPAGNVLDVTRLAEWLETYQTDNPSARDPDTAWMNLKSAALTDAASQRDFEAQLSFG